MTDCKYL